MVCLHFVLAAIVTVVTSNDDDGSNDTRGTQ